MTPEEQAAKFAEHENRIKVSEHRIEDLEKKQDKLETLTLSVQSLAQSVKDLADDQVEYRETQKELASRILKVETKPEKEKADKLDKIAEYILFAVLGAVISFILMSCFGI